MFSATSNYNPKTTFLDAAAKKENFNYILKFGLSANVAHNIDLRLIFFNAPIDNPIIALNVKFNLWVFTCLQSYQLNPSLVVNLMLEVFCKKFHKWKYIEFSKLDQNIRQILKKTFMAKEIYMNRPNTYVN